MADTQIKGKLSADEPISGSLSANKGINASLAPDEEVSGALEVKRTRSIPTNLDDLGDVDITSPQDGQVLKYNALTDEWENADDEDSGVWGSITGTLSDQTDLQNALDEKIPSTEKGSNNGVATLDATGRVPSSQLPSYVDDVLEYASLSAFPATGEAGKIYVALDTNKMYRWSGSTYVEVSESLALGETTGTAYEGSKGKANADAIAKAYKTNDAAETAIADNDYFPFYDTSATGKRKTLWSNIKAKLKAYFDGIYSTFSGSYNDLEDKPTIPAAQIQSDWNQTTTTAKDYIKNKPTIYKKGVYYGTCTGQAANQTKAVTIAAAQGFALEAGATIFVKFDANNTYSATAAAPVKLNVNNTGAKNVYFGGSSAPTGTNTTAFGRANYINQYIYDGTYWVWTGSSADNNTTYSAMSVSELTTGTATTSRTVRADYLKSGINSLIDVKTATLQDQIGDLSDLETQDKSDLVNAINEVAQGGGGGDYYSPSDVAETDIQDTDYFPFYDTSASGKRKSLWSNIKAKLKAYFDGIYSTFSGSYNDLSNKPTVDKVKQNTNTTGQYGHNLLAAVTSETTAETNYVEKTADMKYYPYYRELRLTDTNGSVWTMPQGLAYGLIMGVYNMDAGDTLRFPVTGTDSHIHTDCVVIPVADSKSDGTGYKFRSLKVYNGYAELVLGEDTPAASVKVGLLIYDFTTRELSSS